MKGIKRLAFILILFAGSIWIAWFVATEKQRHEFTHWVGMTITDDGRRIPDSLNTPFGRIELRWIAERLWPEIVNSPSSSPPTGTFLTNRPKSFSHIIYQCVQPKTENIKNNRVVYEWKDSKGKTHFGDKAPRSDYTNLHIMNLAVDDYFSLKIATEHGQLPPFSQDRIDHGVTQIYKTFSDVIKAAELKRVSLNMTFYGTSKAFQAHKLKVAPGLSKLAGGFYSPRSNKISILMQGNRDFMVNVAKHEATHAMVAGMFPGTPVWLNEGLAELFERMKENSFQKKIFEVNLDHVKLLRASRIPPLLEHFAQTPTEWYKLENSRLNYAIDWSLVFFIMKRSDRIQMLRYLLDELATNGCRSVNAVDFLSRHYQGGLNQFEREWRQWIARVKPGSIQFH